MHCLGCNGPTTVTAESVRSDGCMVRTRACAGKRSCGEISTLELPSSALSEFGPKAVEAAVERFRRGFTGRRESARRREVVRLLIGRQTKSSIARFLGISQTAVRNIERELRAAGKLDLQQNPTGVKLAKVHSAFADK